MDYVVFTFIVLIVKCNAGESRSADNLRPLFTSFYSGELEQAVYYTGVINESLDFHFHNMSITNGWCDDFFDANNLEAPTISNSVIHVTNVTHGMSTLWRCTVMESMKNNLKNKIYFLFINLHVKGAKSVEITVNGKALTFSEAELSKSYDGDTIYFYEEGDHVEIICRNPQSTGTVHLEYYMKNATNVSDSGTFCILLHLESNNSYINCVYDTIEPDDKYVYRVTFAIQKQLISLNKSKTKISAKQDTDSTSTSLILGSSVGAVLVILGVTGVACWYVRTRTAKHIETPYGDLTNQNDSQTPQNTNECEYQYDTCHYSANLSNRETYYETPDSVDSMDPEDHYYTKIDYSRCKPKIDKTQTRNSTVYDEPYAHITTRDTMQTLRD